MFTLYGTYVVSSHTIIYLTRSQSMHYYQTNWRVHCKMTKLLGIDWFCTHSCFVIKLTDDKLLTQRPQTNKKLLFLLRKALYEKAYDNS